MKMIIRFILLLLILLIGCKEKSQNNNSEFYNIEICALVNIETRMNEFNFLVKEKINIIQQRLINFKNKKICYVLDGYEEIFPQCLKSNLKSFIFNNVSLSNKCIRNKDFIYFNKGELLNFNVEDSWALVIKSTNIIENISVKNVENVILIGVDKASRKRINLVNIKNLMVLKNDDLKEVKSKRFFISKINKTKGFIVTGKNVNSFLAHKNNAEIEYLRIDYPLKNLHLDGKLVCNGLKGIETIEFIDINDLKLCENDLIKFIRNAKNIECLLPQYFDLKLAFNKNKVLKHFRTNYYLDLEKILKVVSSTDNLITQLTLFGTKLGKMIKVPRQLNKIVLNAPRVKSKKFLDKLKVNLKKQGYKTIHSKVYKYNKSKRLNIHRITIVKI